MAVEVGAGPVVAHRGARVGVPGGDLDITQVHAVVMFCTIDGVSVSRYLSAYPGRARSSQAPTAA